MTMNRKYILMSLLIGMLVGTTTPVMAQQIKKSTVQTGQKTVTGVVVDENGEPVIGATVKVVGDSKAGAITDLDGKFTIKVASNAKLKISYIGYLTQTVAKLETSSANNAEANTMLCTATDNGDNNKIRQAITNGADVNCDAEDGWTPLTNVAYYGHRESMRLLLAAPGIDVNKLNQKGYSALSIAAQKGHTDCVRMLLEAPGINVNLENKSGDSPLCWAASRGSAECIRLLLNAPGININYVDSNGKTALDWAESTNNTVCAQLLREAGAKRANQL